jgi:hypothetical protein
MSFRPDVRVRVRVTVSADIHFRQFDDEGILLDLAKGEYYALNAVGTRMWRALAGGSSPEEIAHALAADYAVEFDVLLEDCVKLVSELVARGFVRLATPP